MYIASSKPAYLFFIFGYIFNSDKDDKLHVSLKIEILFNETTYCEEIQPFMFSLYFAFLDTYEI